MTALDALWHLLNALAAPVGLAGVSSLLARLVFAPAAAGGSLIRLWAWASAAAIAAHVGAWWWMGAEGSMIGYGLMVLATTVVLWWRLFLRA